MFDFTLASKVLEENLSDAQDGVLWGGDDCFPVLAAMEKKKATFQDGAKGKYLRMPVNYALSESASHDFLTAQGKANGSTSGNSSRYENWIINSVEMNDVCFFSRQALDNSSSEMAVVDYVKKEIRNKTISIRQRIAKEILGGDGNGNQCQISARTATTFTVAADQTNKFAKGQDLQFRNTATGAVLGLTSTVTDVNRTTGVITVTNSTSDLVTIGVTATAYVCFKGDNGNSTGTFNSWISTSDILTGSGDSFFQVDRGGSPELYGLVRVAGGGTTNIEDAVLTATAMATDLGQGVYFNTVLVSPQDMAALAKRMGSTQKVLREIPRKGGDGVTYGFNTAKFMIEGVGQSVAVLVAPFVPKGKAFIGDLTGEDSCFLAYDGGQLVRVDKTGLSGGNIFRPLGSDTGAEVRLYARYAFGLNPSRWGVLTAII